MIQILTASLRAACVIAPSKDSRHYLNGVQIIVKKGGAVQVRATDGNMAFVDEAKEKSLLEGVEFVIPLPLATALAKKKEAALSFSLLDPGEWRCGEIIFRPVDGKFPDIDRVIPPLNRGSVPEVPQYDAELLFRAQKAMRIATDRPDQCFRINHANFVGGAAVMHCEDSPYPLTVIMPLNLKVAFKTK